MKSKALLLLFIFLLNTATGFACALRTSIHKHGEATEHHHGGGEVIEHHHEHQQASHPSATLINGTYIANNDPCCQGTVNSFNTLAKVAPQSGQIILLAPFTYIDLYYQLFLKAVSVSIVTRLVSVDGRRRPPTHPIRIALQCFQI